MLLHSEYSALLGSYSKTKNLLIDTLEKPIGAIRKGSYELVGKIRSFENNHPYIFWTVALSSISAASCEALLYGLELLGGVSFRSPSVPHLLSGGLAVMSIPWGIRAGTHSYANRELKELESEIKKLELLKSQNETAEHKETYDVPISLLFS